MSSTEHLPVSDPNAEATEAWDGPLFERFVQYRHVIVGGLSNHGDALIAAHPPAAGARLLDVGCGFGDLSQQLAAAVGPKGDVTGVDVSPRFVRASTEEAAEARTANVAFRVADVQTDDLGGPYDAAYSRFGTMFFANPVAALRNVAGSLRPGGKLAMVVWRRREDNDWVYRAQQIVEGIVSRPEEYDEPTCGPGPFSMAGADTVSDQLMAAGFADVTLRRCELPILVGDDLDEAVDVVMALGPAGEILRLQGDRAAHLHDTVRDALRDGLAEYATSSGIRAPSSTWIVSAVRP
jgi:SAM-dependent methyltransferase